MDSKKQKKNCQMDKGGKLLLIDTKKQKINEHDHNVQERSNPRTHRTRRSNINTKSVGYAFNNITAKKFPSLENIQTFKHKHIQNPKQT